MCPGESITGDGTPASPSAASGTPRDFDDDDIVVGARGYTHAGDPHPLARETETPELVHGVTWLLVRDGCVVLERCEKKAAVLGIGEWFVPGGKLDGDESAIRACQREIAEEWPGVEVLTMDPLPIVEGSSVPPGPRGLFLMRPFVVTVRGDIPPTSGDGVPLRWVPIAEALASPVPQVRMMVAAAARAASSQRVVVAALWAHVQKFIADNDVSCAEAVYQSDGVMLNAYEFIEGCADIVGYAAPTPTPSHQE